MFAARTVKTDDPVPGLEIPFDFPKFPEFPHSKPLLITCELPAGTAAVAGSYWEFRADPPFRPEVPANARREPGADFFVLHPFLAVAKMRAKMRGCGNLRIVAPSGVKPTVILIAGACVAWSSIALAEDPGSAPAPAEAAPAPADKAGKPAVPPDLIDEAHVREELGINEFTAPSIAKLFETLQFLMPIPLADVERKMPEKRPVDRVNWAVELGFLIADGFLVVQAGQMDKVEDLAANMTAYGKALNIGDRVNRHAAPMREHAKKGEVEELKTELSAMQDDVQFELVRLKDADLAHLISLGGWIRALEVATAAVEKQFSPERATKVMREDIADYYTESVAGLHPSISERANFLEMRDILSGFRSEMVVNKGEEPTKEQITEIRGKAAELAELSLQRR